MIGPYALVLGAAIAPGPGFNALVASPRMEPVPAQLVDQVSAQYGSAHRAVHAVGIGLKGTFSPDPGAAKLSSAAIFAGGAIRVTGRFSNSVGFPVLPQLQPDDRHPDVRGFAVKFHLDGAGPEGSMDMVSMTLDRFFDTVADFQGFLRHMAPDPHTGMPNRDAIVEWAHEHLAAAGVLGGYEAIQKLHDPSYAGLAYHGVHTFHYEAADGTVTPGRFRWEPDTPEPPVEELPADTPPDYLRRDITRRTRDGSGAGFTLWLDHPGPADNPNRLSVPWTSKDANDVPIPPTRMGHIQLGALVSDQYWDCEALAFNPARLIAGVSVNPEDQIIAARQVAYDVGHTRRTAIYPRPSRLPS